MQCRMESSSLKLDKFDRFPPDITNVKTGNLLREKTLRTLRACHRRRFSTVLHSRTERFVFRLINWATDSQFFLVGQKTKPAEMENRFRYVSFTFWNIANLQLWVGATSFTSAARPSGSVFLDSPWVMTRVLSFLRISSRRRSLLLTSNRESPSFMYSFSSTGRKGSVYTSAYRNIDLSRL